MEDRHQANGIAMNCCNECETVKHCMIHGCIPKQPAQVARIGRKDYTREELPPTRWRHQLRYLAKWMLVGLLGWLIAGFLVTLVIK